MKKILLAYDGSDASKAALSSMGRMGLPAALEVMVLSVADVWIPPSGAVHSDTEEEARVPEEIRRARRKALRFVEQCGNWAEEARVQLAARFPGWKICAVAMVGPPSGTVVAKARQWGADLVVLGANSRSPLRRWLSGSVSQTIARLAPCSVSVCKADWERPQVPPRIIVAVDGSDDAKEAVEAVLARSWLSGTHFRVISIIDPKLPSSGEMPTLYAGDWMQRHDDPASVPLVRFVQEASDQLRRAGCEVEIKTVEGNPRLRLLQEARDWQADEMFLGARGLEHGQDYDLGSVASSLLIQAPCVIEIARRAILRGPQFNSRTTPVPVLAGSWI